MQIDISPFDTLFFRDGKPFSMGDEVWASGIFPPPPSVIYGALRTGYFASKPAELTQAAGYYATQAEVEADPTTSLVITGLALKHGSGDRYFPVPADLLATKEGDKPIRLKRQICPALSSGKLSHVLKAETIAEPYANGSMLSYSNLKSYLWGDEVDRFQVKSPSFFRVGEGKTGIARSAHTGSAKEGHLYRVEMLRLKKDVSILCEFEGLEIEGPMLKLGGEAKAVRIQPSEQKILPPVADDLEGGVFKLYLASPAIFSQGWLPVWLNADTLEGEIPQTGTKVRLIAAAIGKPVYLGGFDLKARQFKPMRRVVPAGSVYHFEVLHGPFPLGLHGHSISDELPEQGFGITFIGQA